VSHTPRALFFTSASQRVALARQRYFEEGVVPTGVVKKEVLDSWARCQRLRLNPTDSIEFNEVSPSRTHLAFQRNRLLMEAWAGQTSELERMLAGTSCSAMLTDATGVLIASTGPTSSDAQITRVAHRVGINFSEDTIGTTAPGLVLKTGQAATVLGGEHYFDRVQPMYCAAAPIRNIQGELAGVLDISSEHKPFEFDVNAVVSLYATCIENRLLVTQSQDQMIVRLQVTPSLLDTPMAGLVGINARGDLAWANGVAARMIGIDLCNIMCGQASAESVFGRSLPRLLAVNSPSPSRLANGLSVWIKVETPASDGANGIQVAVIGHAPGHAALIDTGTSKHAAELDTAPRASSSMTSTLKDLDKSLIRQTVQSYNGNISKAAKHLGVSRGMIYRRLMPDGETPRPADVQTSEVVSEQNKNI
jgi:sigma-54 dependent transcriptional regulator, acetoin dehydrogenase operon transcriptional activator AcoR